MYYIKPEIAAFDRKSYLHLLLKQKTVSLSQWRRKGQGRQQGQGSENTTAPFFLEETKLNQSAANLYRENPTRKYMKSILIFSKNRKSN